MPKKTKPPLNPHVPAIVHSHAPKAKRRFFDAHQWSAPNFRQFDMLQNIQFAVNGYGGELDLSWFYFDPIGAANWLTIAQNQDYLTTQQGVSTTQIANAIFHHWRHSGFSKKEIHVVGLGCGTGLMEIHIVNRLLDYLPDGNIHLYLLDLSPSLLNDAEFNARRSFINKSNVSVTSLYGDFKNLSSYPPFIQMSKDCKDKELIVLSMFGYTFGNLTSEQLFVRNSFRVFPKDTLFITDLILTSGLASRPEEVKKKDPRLSGQAHWQFAKEYEDFWKGPIQRHRDNLATEVKILEKLDYSNCIEGSYAIEISAIVDKSLPFTLGRLKRHDPQGLANMFRQEGWVPDQGFRYGLEMNPRMVYLFRKQ